MASDRPCKIRISLFFLLSCCAVAAQAADPGIVPARHKPTAVKRQQLDHSGEPRRGKASFYGSEFFGRKMADGTPMNPNSNVAASRTLPLGTKAKVTNLRNGKSAIVEIKDRGPYVDGRIVDLSPKIANQLGFRKEGLAPVEVTPVEIPLPDGSIKLGAAAPIVQAANEP